MTEKVIPQSEIKELIKIILENYSAQFNKPINPNDVTSNFIPARDDTLIGFQVTATVTGSTLKIRLYASSFSDNPGINPFRIEEKQNTPTSQRIQVFVSISDLPVDKFPVLSKTTNPLSFDEAGPYAIELEDRSGYIMTEDDDYITSETRVNS